MGNSNSAAIATAENETSVAKESIIRACSDYIEFMETTSMMIDVNISDLAAELQSKVNSVKGSDAFKTLPIATFNSLAGDLEKCCNTQKFSVRRFFLTLQEAYDRFEEIAESLDEAEETEDIPSTDDLFHELRHVAKEYIAQYSKELDDLKPEMTREIQEQRVAAFRRMLFKASETVVDIAVLEYIQSCKERAIEEIDNLFCTGMTRGAFDGSDVVSTRGLLQSIIYVSHDLCLSLEELPFPTKEDIIEEAKEQIKSTVGDIIRRVQLTFANQPDFLEALMDLDVDDFFIEDDDEDDVDVLSLEDLDDEINDYAGEFDGDEEEAAMIIKKAQEAISTDEEDESEHEEDSDDEEEEEIVEAKVSGKKRGRTSTASNAPSKKNSTSKKTVSTPVKKAQKANVKDPSSNLKSSPAKAQARTRRGNAKK